MELSVELSGSGVMDAKMEKYLKYCCSVCAKICRCRKELAQHMNIHTGAKPYVCDQENCGAKFSHPSNLYRHVRTVHMKP